mgnify:CR=1 FL=1
MRSFIDFSSWQGFLGTIISLLVMTLLMIGIRLVFMQTIQRKRERENRQINSAAGTVNERVTSRSELTSLRDSLPASFIQASS